MIDLHIHTNATPHHATWTPETLVAAAYEAGLRVIAVADHNSTASVAAVQHAGARFGLTVISGVEIDSAFPAAGPSPIPLKLWHTLVYGAPPDHPDLVVLCQSVYDRNMEDAVRLRAILGERGFQLPGLETLGRPANVADVGAALARNNPIERRPGEDEESAGMRYILTDIPGGYRPVGVAEVIDIAHRCGGVAILAHPGRSKGVYAIPATDEDLDAMAAAGLDGIEVYYPSHSAEQRKRYRAAAERLGLLITGGSDSHHPHQPLAAWPAASVADFLARMGVSI